MGIGLPNFFINVDYQYYVLPLVLLILLVIVPGLMIRWNNKTKALDQSGISVGSYPVLFKSLQTKADKFTFPYIISGFPELYEDQNYGPIS